jgi:hypothetical protein
MLFCGILLFAIGIFGYFFYPVTILSKKSDLFIALFIIILMGMLLGLVFLGLNVEFVIEYIISNFVFIFEDGWHRMILLRNIFKDRVCYIKYIFMHFKCNIYLLASIYIFICMFILFVYDYRRYIKTIIYLFILLTDFKPKNNYNIFCLTWIYYLCWCFY